jgi:hypothetical protein
MAINFYSVRNDFIGLAIAALIDLYPTVIQAIATDTAIATRNTKTPISILKAKLLSQLLII